MTATTNNIVVFNIPEQSFWTRAKDMLVGAIIVTLIMSNIVFFTSKSPLQDTMVVMFGCIIFSSILTLAPYRRNFYSIVFEKNKLILNGRYFNRTIIEEINYRDLSLSVNALYRSYHSGVIVGYQLKISNKNKLCGIIGENNGWSTLIVYKILVEIKSKRAMNNIHRVDGTFFIDEINHFLIG